MEPIELFLSPADADRGGQTLERGLDASALASAAAEARNLVPRIFRDVGQDPNSLADQGWAVIAPRGEHGDRLLALARRLIDQRAQDQGGEVTIYRVQPDMSASQAVAWLDRKFVGNELEASIPGYVLILGGLDQVSSAFQQVLSTESHVGRLGFDEDAHYEAYIDKLLHWQHAAPAAQARALFFTARDGTAATELGQRLLVQPSLEDARAQHGRGMFPVSEILDLAQDQDDDGAEGPARAGARLVDAARVNQPSILLSCSHGLGAPRHGWRSLDHQRALQGALCLGQGEHIAADNLRDTPFLPGGLWLYFACFGAGTPAYSAYHHWLARLHQLGELGSSLDAVLASLPRAGEPPFLAALPKAVLANPEGPLAVIGHLDLAWSYSFQDIEKMSRNERHRRFQGVLGQMALGSRVGVAFGRLLRAREQVKTDLTTAADQAERAQASQASCDESPDERIRLGHRWMLHQDVDGYILLGDPAARLPIALRAARKPLQTSAASAAVLTTPAPEPAPQAASLAARATAGQALPDPLELEDLEEAVHAMIAGNEAPRDLAEKYGVDKQTLKTWERIYTEAGRKALAALLEAARKR